jgi:hypothetical protein
MPVIQNLFKKTKANPDIWFFYPFLLSFSFSIRKILFYFPIKGTFNEYTAIFVYISDIFLFLTIISWLITILCNNSYLLSTYRLWITPFLHKLYSNLVLELKFLFHNNITDRLSKSKIENVPRLPRRMFHMEHSLRDGTIVIIPLIFVAWSFISIFWSQNQPVALFRSIKLIEYYLLYIYILLRFVPRETNKSSTWNNTFSIIIFISIFQSIIGILQFITQRSIGLYWLGESHISQVMPGVAKIILNGHTLIRSYGLFPHPNIFAGFLLLSIVLCMIYKNTNHRPLLLSSRIRFKGFTIVIGRKNLDFIIFIQSFALILSFSKSAIIGLAIALFYIYVPPASRRRASPRVEAGVEQYCSFRGGIHTKNLTANRNFRVIILSLLIIVFWLHLAGPNFDSILYKSLNERILYLNVSRGTIMANPLIGVGIGQFVVDMAKYTPKLEAWQFQPVHNVFLLVWSELGIVGLGLFIYWLYKMFHVKQFTPSPYEGEGAWRADEVRVDLNKTDKREVAASDKSILENKSYYLSNVRLLRYFKAILLGFIFIMLFDHYFWDIQQGSIMLWMILGFIAGLKRI